MARDRSPIVKQSRREGYALHAKAHKIMARKSGIPGVHAHGRQNKPSLYATQLREKQKVRRTYGLLEKQFARKFPGPGDVTAFRPDFAAHGKCGQPCPVCKSPIQRIIYAENETNYCATGQTGGKLLADRSMSRLLKDDWPRTLEELEELKRPTM